MGSDGEELSDGLAIRHVVPADLDAIVGIENQSFPGPWPRTVFERELRNDWSTVEAVFDPGDQLIAYLVYWVVHDELHILNIAVHPVQRRKGLARQLLHYLERVCERRQLTYLTLEVRVSNTAAVHLYETQGYQIIHRRKDYYVDEREDALVMAKVLEGDKLS